MPRGWHEESRRLVIGTGVLVVLGLLSGHFLIVLLAGSVAYLLWHLRQLYVLEQWLAGSTSGGQPQAVGMWADVRAHLDRLKRKNKKRKHRLRNVVARFEQAAEASPDATVVLGADGDIIWFNSAARRMLGLNHPKDAGQPITNLLRLPQFVDYLAAGEFDEPLAMDSPVNEEQRLLLRVTPYGGGRCLLLARDDTRRYRLEQMRKDFVANVSHELRSPLTVILGYLEALREDQKVPSGWQRALEQSHEQALRMSRLVDDLLGLSRIEHDPGGAPRVPVNVADMLSAIRDEAASLGQNVHVFRIDADPSLRVLGDYKELYSAFSNLVFNAVQYTPDGGDIGLRWFAEKDSATLEVRDNGIGIDAHHLGRLTERFYRVDEARSREVGGTGLGLAIVKHVLLRHDATLDVQSTPGEGATFLCRFSPARVVRDADAIRAVS